MSWVAVNMPWRITRSVIAEALSQTFIAAVNTAKAQWKADHPEQITLDTVSDQFSEVFEVQDQYPWLRGHIEAPDLEAWREESLRKCDDAPPGLRVKMRALVIHRYWYRLESNYVDNDPYVVLASKSCQERRELEKTLEFCHHPACEVGVQIEVSTNGVTRKLLIGDITAGGMDSGCCADGISDDDIIVRYRDLRPLLKEQDA